MMEVTVVAVEQVFNEVLARLTRYFTEECAAAGLSFSRSRLDTAPGAAVCARDGRRWRIGLGGRWVLVEDSVGIGPSGEVDRQPRRRDSRDRPGHTERVAHPARYAAAPILDEVALRQYRLRLRECRSELGEAEAATTPHARPIARRSGVADPRTADRDRTRRTHTHLHRQPERAASPSARQSGVH